jgi:HSP20 family protein
MSTPAIDIHHDGGQGLWVALIVNQKPEIMALPNRYSFPTLADMVENFFGADDDMQRFWDRSPKVPAVNVSETENGYQLEVATPGMNKDDFEVEVKDGVLTISSESRSEKEEESEKYTRREFSYSAFKRSFVLPEEVEAEQIKASYRDGILYLDLPKKAIPEAKPVKRIDIH